MQSPAQSQPLKVHDAPHAEPDRDDHLVVPRAIREWRTRKGKSLEWVAIMAWSWLYTRAGAGKLPIATPCTKRQLTEWLGRKDRKSASNAFETLKREGLAELVDSASGPHGGSLIRLLDHESLTHLHVIRPDPQTELGFSDDARDGANSPAPEESLPHPARPNVANSPPTAESLPHHRPAATPQGLPPKLRDMIAQRIGEERFEQWLGQTRWEANGPSLTCFLPTEFELAHARRTLRQDVAEAATAAGFQDVEFSVEPAGRNVANSPAPEESLPHQSAQEQPLVRNPTWVSNQPKQTNQQPPPHAAGSGGAATNAASQPGADASAGLLRRARALYRRVKDPTLYRWIAIDAVHLVDQGKITRADIEQILKQTPEEFPRAIKELAGKDWGFLACKRRLARLTPPIPWRREYERSDAQPGRGPPWL